MGLVSLRKIILLFVNKHQEMREERKSTIRVQYWSEHFAQSNIQCKLKEFFLIGIMWVTYGVDLNSGAAGIPQATVNCASGYFLFK